MNDAGAIEVRFRLACAWQARGRLDAAESGLRELLQRDAAFVPAHVKMGEVLLERGRLDEAVAAFSTALALEPQNADLHFRVNYLRDLLHTENGTSATRLPHDREPAAALPDQAGGKVNLNHQKSFRCHRSGWNYALSALEAVHHSGGVRFDGFIENHFAWQHWRSGKRDAATLERLRASGSFDQLATSEERGITPYREPWVGFVHNPYQMPHWFHPQESPQTIFAKPIWQESLEHCRGLFTFSYHHADWLKSATGKPVSVVTLPTEIPGRQFDFNQFIANPHKEIVQIGWWLRRLSAIYELPLARDNPLGYRKTRLVPMFFDNADAYLRKLMAKEIETLGIVLPERYAGNTREVVHLSNLEYDELLSCNIAFVQLYDANANNTVIECIARATPLLVNPLPAVVEYLGPDYPLYFEDLEEAADIALDLDRVERAHRYLLACPTRSRLSRASFLEAFVASDVYREL